LLLTAELVDRPGDAASVFAAFILSQVINSLVHFPRQAGKESVQGPMLKLWPSLLHFYGNIVSYLLTGTYFFGGLECVGHSFAYVSYFFFF
jgi:hypothetical protein